MTQIDVIYESRVEPPREGVFSRLNSDTSYIKRYIGLMDLT